jgi:hypothetical protein
MGWADLLKEVLEDAVKQQAGSGGATQAPAKPRTLPGPRPLPQAPPPKGGGTVGDVVQAVVQVVALRQQFMGGMSSAWTGSGSIVHPAGIVLTNCHVASPRSMGMSAPPADRMAIAITENPDDAPAISYFAEVVATDPELDLAVMRIVSDVRGRAVQNLNLPYLPIGNSDDMRLGDKVSIYGYPGIGGETVTYTAGNVSGFSHDKAAQASRGWIKTDATIAGGNSGGAAVNDSGELIGIPTQAAAGSGVTPVDARPVLDTNGDGRIDQRDTPMAIGGFINGLRPVSLALALLREAGLDVKPGSGRPAARPSAPAPRQQATAREAKFSDLLFSTSVADDGRPINPTSIVPLGADTVYATFEYEGMTPGTPWSAVWMSNGQQIIAQENTWDEEPQGRKAVKISNKRGLPEGEYHLVLGIGGAVALEGKMLVGTPVDESDSEVSGRLVDGDSNSPLAGAMVLVLKPDASLHEFLSQQDQSLVYSQTNTGSDGRFTFPQQLPKGQAYSLLAFARGYEPLAIESALRVSAGAPEKANIGDIALNRSGRGF